MSEFIGNKTSIYWTIIMALKSKFFVCVHVHVQLVHGFSKLWFCIEWCTLRTSHVTDCRLFNRLKWRENENETFPRRKRTTNNFLFNFVSNFNSSRPWRHCRKGSQFSDLKKGNDIPIGRSTSTSSNYSSYCSLMNFPKFEISIFESNYEKGKGPS